MTARLSSVEGVAPGVARPGYAREAHGVGIVHIGLGAFAKAHTALYTDDALAAEGGDWRIAGVGLRSPTAARELGPQNGLYTVLERGAEGSRARVVGSVARALAFSDGRAAVERALTDPHARIVTLTVTEKGYGLDRETGGCDPAHPAIAADLANPAAPAGVAGLLVRALGLRRAAGTPPFAVLCCDNLPENGRLVRGLVVDFARRAAPDLAEFIAGEVAFPGAMVDRIAPARGAGVLDEASALIGLRDEAAVACEPFRQWAIEDRFPQGRPAWEAGGALFTDDVRPFEAMKLRMLNGAHSMLAYSGFLCGRAHVRDVMADPALARLVARHLDAAAATLAPVPGVDLADYARALGDRFANPHLAHETRQIATDGTEKLPQRILAPALDAVMAGRDAGPFAFAVAAWMRYALGRTDAGDTYPLNDPRADEIAARIGDARDADALVARLQALPGLFPAALRDDPGWSRAVAERLRAMLDRGVAEATRLEAGCAEG